jgi:hypothetical protein
MFGIRKMFFAALAVLVAGSGAHAGFTIDYNLSGTGTVSYNGSGGQLVGSNLGISNITSTNPGVPGPLTLTGGLLNFNTANYLSMDGSGDLFFATTPGSTITITGTTTATGATTAQLTGVLTGTAEVLNFGGVFEIVETALFSPTTPAVAAYFGDPTGVPYVGNMVITFQPGSQGFGSLGNGFTTSGGIISSGNVGVVPTPAPSGLLLAGCGGAFCLLGYAVRRRQMTLASAMA